MSDLLQARLQPGAPTSTSFAPTSRYYGLGTSKMKTPEGKTVIYLGRRFVPPPERFALLTEHLVTQDERLDNIAALHPGDPEGFWRLCDANNALRPDELTEEVGRRLRITLPEGVPVTPGF